MSLDYSIHFPFVAQVQYYDHTELYYIDNTYLHERLFYKICNKLNNMGDFNPFKDFCKKYSTFDEYFKFYTKIDFHEYALLSTNIQEKLFYDINYINNLFKLNQELISDIEIFLDETNSLQKRIEVAKNICDKLNSKPLTTPTTNNYPSIEIRYLNLTNILS